MNLPALRRRPPPALQALAWFVPGWIAVALAGFSRSPLVLIPLLAANALTMAAVCHAIGFDPEPRFGRTVLRRGAAHLVMFTGYAALVFALIAWPMLLLNRAPTLAAALGLAAALVLALVALWRLWPAFGLVFVWDDAYPAGNDGSWIFAATARSLAFGRHLSREERLFSHFLPAAMALLALAFVAIALTGLYGVLPSEMRVAALAVYGLVLLPLGCLLVANRTLRALLSEGRRPRKRGRWTRRARTAGKPATSPPRASEPVPAPVVLNAEERAAGTPEQAAALVAAARAGDVARALALLEAGADPQAAPAAQDRDQRPLLTLAALLTDTRLLRALIAKGAPVDRAQSGLTALLAATRDSWHGRPEAVMTLLANGADAQATDAEGNTALHGAVLSGEPTVAAMLLDASAPINALNRAGVSPLSAACRAANWPLVTFLLDRGARPAPPDGEPALVAAAGIADDDPTGVKLLLKARAAVNATDGRRRSALMQAAAEGHERIASTLRAAGADAGLADRRGGTALMEAARAGAGAIVQLIAQAQPDVHVRDGHGRDALTHACQSPHAHGDTIKALLALGADPRAAGPDGRSALDHAAGAGRWDLVALLDPDTPLPANLDLDLLADGADTPAHLLDALRFGHWAIVSTFHERARSWPQQQLAQLYLDLSAPGLGAARRWLLEHGLDAEARLAVVAAGTGPADAPHPETTAKPPLGRRLFDQLVQRLPASTEAIDDLLQTGAQPSGAGLLAQALGRLDHSVQGAALPLALLERGADPFGRDARGRTPLHLAAALGDTALVEALLARGCDPNARDHAGRTPLFAALEHGARALHLVRALIAHGGDAEATDANGDTPLGLALEHPAVERWLNWGEWPRPRRPIRPDDLPAAARAGAAVAVQRLLEMGLPVDTRDAQGATALLHACGAGRPELARILLDAGADTELAAGNGVTALVAAVVHRRDAIVDLLLSRGAAADHRMPGEVTALMVAAGTGNAEAGERLLAAGAALDAVDAHGRSALHAASQYGFEQSDSLRARRLFDLLLGQRADVNLADREGDTPLLLLLGAHRRPGSGCDATHIGALVPVLLDAGATVGHADARGVTALHACAMHALLPAARLLLARGAERGAEDAFGRTAADLARQLGLVDIAHELAVRGGHAVLPSVRQTLRQPAQPAD